MSGCDGILNNLKIGIYFNQAEALASLIRAIINQSPYSVDWTKLSREAETLKKKWQTNYEGAGGGNLENPPVQDLIDAINSNFEGSE